MVRAPAVAAVASVAVAAAVVAAGGNLGLGMLKRACVKVGPGGSCDGAQDPYGKPDGFLFFQQLLDYVVRRGNVRGSVVFDGNVAGLGRLSRYLLRLSQMSQPVSLFCEHRVSRVKNRRVSRLRMPVEKVSVARETGGTVPQEKRRIGRKWLRNCLSAG